MAETKPNAQYSLARPDSLPVRLATWQRRRMFALFLKATGIGPQETLLDVGATSDRTFESSNYLSAWYPHKARITALGLDDAGFLEDVHPGLRFVRGNGLQLPFCDRAFDVVHSSAVIEHVGSFKNQTRFVSECARVARRAVFLTTPNRWFPIEFHTQLPLLHWLPKPWFRALARSFGYGFFADEANLNLMTAAELRRASAGVPGMRFQVFSVPLGGWPSNLILLGHRD